MGKRSPPDALKSLFSEDNPFRRKPSPAVEAPKPEQTRVKKLKSEEKSLIQNQNQNQNQGSPPKAFDDEKKEEERRKRKRKREDQVENETGKTNEERLKALSLTIGGKRKADDMAAEAAPFKEEPEPFDDEKKLLRTVFVGNLPLKIKRKTILKEFQQFGEVESVRIRSVPIVDSKVPRKGAIMKGKVNEAVDCVHAYVVFKEEQAATAALAHNMALFEGNHIRVDMACPPRKKLKGEGPLYDRKRTVFVGNLPFDVKDEELYSLFCGISNSVEAIRVVRDGETSMGKGIAYVLFKTRDDANTIVRRRELKIRDRSLRVYHAKSADSAPKKSPTPKANKTFSKNKFTSPTPSITKKASNLSYQGTRSSKSGGPPKKTAMRTTPSGTHKRKNVESTSDESVKKKRPAVAARKAKQLLKKRKLESATPENTHKNKKPKKH